MNENHAHRRFPDERGTTGLWQVSGRSNLSSEDAVRLDLHCVENWSITGDLVIMWRTARAVKGRDGASEAWALSARSEIRGPQTVLELAFNFAAKGVSIIPTSPFLGVRISHGRNQCDLTCITWRTGRLLVTR